MAEKKSFLMYTEWAEAFEMLNEEQAGELIKAIFKYENGEEVSISDPTARMAFMMMKNRFDENSRRYEEKVERASRARSSRTVNKEENTENKDADSEIKKENSNIRNSVSDIRNENSENKDMDSNINGVTDTVTVTVTDTVTDKENNTSCPTEPDEVKPAAEKNSSYPPKWTTAKTYTERGFCEFWDEYPKKSGKGDAWKSWKKIKPDVDLKHAILEAIKKQKTSAQWMRAGGQFIPMPATWLNQCRWDDELEEVGNGYDNTSPDKTDWSKPIDWDSL